MKTSPTPPNTAPPAGPEHDSARPLGLARYRWSGALLALNVAGLLAVAGWFRLRMLGNLPGLNGDEAWYGVQAVRLLGGEPIEWTTPTGNPLNPLFFGPLVAFHWLFGGSIAVLRAVAVLSGLAALVLNWVFCRKVFGGRTAIISTVILAVLPVQIAYSRFAWDASQSVLAVLPVWYLSLGAVGARQRGRRWLTASAVCLLLAMLVHPANVFAAAASLAAASTAWHEKRKASAPKTVPPFPARTALIVAAAAIVAALSVAAAVWADTTAACVAAGRLAGPAAWLCPGTLSSCAARSARLLTGGTTYHFLSGSVSWLQWPAGGRGPDWASVWGLDVWVFWVLVGASLWAIGRQVARGGASADRALVGGCALGLVGYWLAVGPEGLVPGYERYALCLVVPLVIVVSRGMELLGERSGRAGRLVAAIGIVLGWLLLADFHQHYFCFTEQTGGRAHHTFRTAPVDPKQAAAQMILAHLHAGERPPKEPNHKPAAAPGTRADATAQSSNVAPCYIVTSEWWSEWALRYFTSGNGRVRVLGPSGEAGETPPAAASAQGRVFWVEFAGSKRLDELRSRLAGPGLVEWPVCDYAGRAVLWVLHHEADAGSDLP